MAPATAYLVDELEDEKPERYRARLVQTSTGSSETWASLSPSQPSVEPSAEEKLTGLFEKLIASTAPEQRDAAIANALAVGPRGRRREK